RSVWNQASRKVSVRSLDDRMWNRALPVGATRTRVPRYWVQMGPAPLIASAVSGLRGLLQVAALKYVHQKELGRLAARCTHRLAFSLGDIICHSSTPVGADFLHSVSSVCSFSDGSEQPPLL